MEDLQKRIDILVTRIQGFTSEITISDLEHQGDIVIELHDLKKCLKGGLTSINKIFDHASEYLCRTIADQLEDVTYRHPKATITASARGFFSIVNPEEFIKWYEILYPEGNGLRKLIELVSSKKKINEFFELEVLSQGLPLPSCVKSHVIANVKIRKNNHGKEENS